MQDEPESDGAVEIFKKSFCFLEIIECRRKEKIKKN